jgi:hypothetical protein
VTKVGQYQRLWRQIANLQSLHLHTAQLKALLHGVEQRGGA